MEARPPTRPVPWTLMTTAAWACGAALACREFGLPALAGVLGLILLDRLRAESWTPALIALPAALGALEIPPQPAFSSDPRGILWISGQVESGQRRDPRSGHQLLPMLCAGREILLQVEGELRALPGDRLSGPAYFPAGTKPTGARWRPRLKAQAGALEHRPGGWSATRQAEACRLALQDSLLRLLPGDEGRLLCHLALGRGPALEADLVSAHRRTGLTHLLAVSGAHASMLAWMMGLLYRLCSGRRAWTSRAFRRTAAILLLIYGAITGWEPPVFRALAAFGLMLLASARGRRLSIHACLAFPAILTAVLQPDELFGPSFCLSYAAVIGLSLAGAFRAMNPWQQWLALPLRASLWAVICTAPFSLVYFGQFAPWTLIATPLLGPVVAAMLGMAILCALLGLVFPVLASLLAALLGPLTGSYEMLVRTFADLPAAPVYAISSPDPCLLVGGGIFGLLGLLLWPGRRGVAVFCLSLCLPHFLPRLPRPGPMLQLLSVGHGQACILHTARARQVLVDCGSLGNPQRAGRAVVASLQRRRIDLLLLSHGDQDHSGGLATVLDRLPISRAIVPANLAKSAAVELLRASGTETLLLEPGEIWVEEDLMVLAPAIGPASSNDSGLWLRAQVGELSCLFPGDAGEAGIRAFLQMLPDARADVFVLPHHGRGDPLILRTLLNRLQPALTLVSNRSSEASTILGELARSMGIGVLHTGRRGDIRIQGGAGLQVDCEYPARIELAPR